MANIRKRFKGIVGLMADEDEFLIRSTQRAIWMGTKRRSKSSVLRNEFN